MMWDKVAKPTVYLQITLTLKKSPAFVYTCLAPLHFQCSAANMAQGMSYSQIVYYCNDCPNAQCYCNPSCESSSTVFPHLFLQWCSEEKQLINFEISQQLML